LSPRVFPVRPAGALVAVVASCALLAGCAGTDLAQDGTGGSNRFIAGDGSVQVIEQADRKAPIQASGTTLEDERFAVSDHRNKVTVVNFWASWCAPCRGEAPSLQQVHDQTKAQDVQFVGVAFKDAKANARAFERKFKITYPSLFDADGRITLAFREVPPNAIPTTLVLDRQGRVAARVIGATTYSKLHPLVTQILEER
jgi:thiol-disulfide isomerase/thioredoxin